MSPIQPLILNSTISLIFMLPMCGWIASDKIQNCIVTYHVNVYIYAVVVGMHHMRTCTHAV